MKKLFIVFVVVALYGAVSVLSAGAWLLPPSKVVLSEIIGGPTPKSPAICGSVEVEQNATSIEVGFTANLGNLNIEVCNQAGTSVFEKKVTAAFGSSLSIPIQGWASGTYTIRILNDQGNGCEGKFVI
jgi:hypothetical protein